MKTMRLDAWLVESGHCIDKDTALRRIIAGDVLVNESVASSAAYPIKKDDVIRVKGGKRFVSRGGDKLQAALDTLAIDVAGLRCIDVGSSTGGFTDCLLQAGAASVACVDVNYGQLAWEIRQDPRVNVFERTNIRLADPKELGAPFDMVVIDVSFIGLAGLASVLASLCHEGSSLIALVKPQFEAAHDETDHGVVRSASVRQRTLHEVISALEDNGFAVVDSMESPVVGPAGNREFLVHAKMAPSAREAH